MLSPYLFYYRTIVPQANLKDYFVFLKVREWGNFGDMRLRGEMLLIVIHDHENVSDHEFICKRKVRMRTKVLITLQAIIRDMNIRPKS